MSQILVIEDNVSILDNLGILLQLEGYQVLTANNGRSGIELANQEQPDLILCDVTMPDIDGYGVIGALSANVRTAGIPFIFLTAKQTGEEMRAGMKLGADDYITKPFLVQDLLTAIETRLTKRDRLRKSGCAEIERLCESLAQTLPYQLNAPLTGILGAADLIRDLEEDEVDITEIRDLVNIITTSAGQLKDFNQRLLSYVSLKLLKISPTRLNSDDYDLHIAMIQPSIHRLAMDCATKYQRTTDLQLDLQDGYVAISDYWLQLLASELLDNAFKFSPVDTPVYLSCDFSRAGMCSIHLVNWSQAIDSIRPDYAPLFCRSDRLRDGRSGAGIGLAIVAALLELHSGTLTYTYEEGKTCVTVTLPIWNMQETATVHADQTTDQLSVISAQKL